MNSAGKTRATAQGKWERETHEIQYQSPLRNGCDRRLLAVGAGTPLAAQTPANLRFSAVFSEQDIRAEMMKRFADDIKAQGFTLQPYYGGTLFKQGTELVAMQRNNLEMGNIAPQDISTQIPAWSIVTSAYLFRDADHLKKVFAGDVGQQLKKMASDQLGIHILGPTYFGARQVGLKPTKKINTPADMAGIKLRMPGGDAWQFLGPGDRRQPNANGLCGSLYGASDRRDRRAGQSPAECPEHEILRGDVAVALTSHLVGFDLLASPTRSEFDVAGETGGVPGRCRQSDRVEHPGAPEERGRTGQLLQGEGPQSLYPGPQSFPRVRSEKVPCVGSRQKLAPGMLGQDQRHVNDARLRGANIPAEVASLAKSSSAPIPMIFRQGFFA